MQIIAAGQVVDYIDQGKGPVLLMVHGWRDQKSTWQPLIEQLKANFRCIAVDLPNFGASADNEAVTDLRAYADALAEFVDKLALTDYTYVGHSMGGQIGIYAAAHKVLRPSRLILIASAGIRDDKARRRKVLKAGSVMFGRFVPVMAKKKLYQLIGSDYDPSLSTIHKNIIDAVLSADVQREASLVSVPTLLIYGSADDATPPEYGELLGSLINGSAYIQLEGYDHFVHQQAAGGVAKAVRIFMEPGA